jgi:hypothetical protein
MIASFDKDELMASLAELEKRVSEHTSSGRLTAAPSAQLDIELAAILDSVKSRSPLKATPCEDAARLADDPPPDQAALSRSTALILVPEKGLRASAAGRESAANAAGVEDATRLADERGDQAAPPSIATALIRVPEKELLASAAGKEIALSRHPRRVYAAAAILIVIGSLVGSTGHLPGGRVLAALEAPPALQKFGPPPETTAQAPAAKQTAEGGPATPETAAVVPPPPVAKALAAVEPPPPAVVPPTPEATIAKPAKRRKKPMAGQSEFRAFTSQFGKLAGGVTAALRHISTSLIPQ